MADKITTECYKCGAEIEVPDEDVVHPLCQDCQGRFEDWFEQAMRGGR